MGETPRELLLVQEAGGRDARIASRAVDDTGYVQPTRAALVTARGTNSTYHYNGIKVWHVRADGTVTNVEA